MPKAVDLAAVTAEAQTALSQATAATEGGTTPVEATQPLTLATNTANVGVLAAAGGKTETAPSLEQTVASAVAEIADQIEAGAKAQEREEMNARINEAVQAAVAGLRAGRKTPMEASGHLQTIGSPAFIRQIGDKATFGMWLAAAGRKALGYADADRELNDIYRAAGGKALAEGTGATLSNTVSGPNGGFIVPPQFATSMIEFLYAFTVLRAAGTTVMPMDSNIFYQSRLAGTATANYVGENTPIPVSNQQFTQFQLTAKKLTAFTPVSRELVEDSSPSIETIVRNDLTRQIGLAEDYAWLVGVGSTTTPQGILTASGTTQINPTDATNGDPASYDQLVDLQTKLALANIPLQRRVWICHPQVLGAYRKVTDLYGHPLFSEFNNVQDSSLMPGMPSVAMKPSGQLFGYPVYTSSQLPLTTLNGHVCGNMAFVEISQVLAGQRGQMEIDATTQGTFVDSLGNLVSAYQSDMVLYRALIRHDIGLLHPLAVAVQKSVQI